MSATLHGNNPNLTLSSENSCRCREQNEGKREQKPHLDASEHTSTWASSTSMSVSRRTASLLGFSTPSTSTLSSTFASNSSRKLRLMKLISKKVPPSPGREFEAKTEKEAASTPGDIAIQEITCASSSGSRSTSTVVSRLLLMHLCEEIEIRIAREALSPILQMTSPPNESFSMHVDDVLPPPKCAVGRTPSIVMGASLAVSSSNSGFMSPSKALTTASTSVSTAVPEKMPQSRHVVAPSATQRGPPPLGMRRQHNLPNSGFPLSQSRYATTQSPYAASQAKGQKPVMLPPFKPPLLKKPNPKAVPAPKQVFQTPESPPTSTPELVKDDSNDDGDEEEEDKLGAAGADSSFDVSFDVDVDALEATMRQYD
ncbi:uncharacterized protein HD556DRAFT_1309006 [Suillus plorans]|uniref:Uncharacterized protein n=1 Tax=Suillus plorans TaxID=116603 RepID=A0A9P7ANG0_9AGAM|nr:uncharacterized protein HD556DRAFT_1309006 [Suillus plorans]KAG1792981.1 hypothetical protein HD556DRAFT_1309006 [Suillus plorans]